MYWNVTQAREIAAEIWINSNMDVLKRLEQEQYCINWHKINSNMDVLKQNRPSIDSGLHIGINSNMDVLKLRLSLKKWENRQD